jgi:lantibiotic biosynthesis protein
VTIFVGPAATGAVAARCEAVAASIIGDILDDLQQSKLSGRSQLQDFSLGSGASGLAFTIACSTKALSIPSGDRLVHELLSAAGERARQMSARIGLHTGLSGLVFAATAASCDGTRYQNFLRQLNARISECCDRLASRICISSDQPSATFDVVSGVSGAAASLLLDVNNQEGSIRQILNCLVWLAGHERGTPRLRTAGRTVGTLSDVFQHDHVNCGLAHGLPGPLAALSLALIEGIEVAGHRAAIQSSVDWLLSHRINSSDSVDWPYAVRLDDTGHTNPPARFAWCYGIPGIVRALSLAGSALKEPEYTRFAGVVLHDALLRRRDAHTDEFHLCHGVAGLLAVVLRFQQEDSRHDWRPFVDRFLERLLAGYRSDVRYGFSSLRSDGTHQHHPGLLDGAAGIAVALLAACGEVPRWWDRMLLLG